MDKNYLEKHIQNALEEDIQSGDFSSIACIDKTAGRKVRLIAKQDGILCGVDVFCKVFELMDSEKDIKIERLLEDGTKIKKGDLILKISGNARNILGAERTALNYIQSHDDVGALGVRVCLEDGKLDKACRRSFPNPTNSFYRLFHIPSHNNSNDDYNLDNLDDSGIYEIDCLTGAFILMRSKVMDEIGLLDETFFMYGEDIDLCYRIKKAGYKIVYYGKVKITHLKGASSKKQKNKLIYEFYRAMYIFYHKHYRDRYSPLLNGLVYIGIALLLIVHLVLNLFKKSN